MGIMIEVYPLTREDQKRLQAVKEKVKIKRKKIIDLLKYPWYNDDSNIIRNKRKIDN